MHFFYGEHNATHHKGVGPFLHPFQIMLCGVLWRCFKGPANIDPNSFKNTLKTFHRDSDVTHIIMKARV